MSLTRARSPSCKNGLPDLRLLPRCPRPGRSHRTHPPGRQRARGGSWSRKASAAFHTRYQHRREPAHAGTQDDQDQRTLPQRRRRAPTDLARDHARQDNLANLLQLDASDGSPTHPLRRPHPRQHLTTHRYTEKRAGSDAIGRSAVGDTPRRRGAIVEAVLTLEPVAANPLARTTQTDTGRRSRRGERPTLYQHTLGQQPPTAPTERRVTVKLHPGPPSD